MLQVAPSRRSNPVDREATILQPNRLKRIPLSQIGYPMKKPNRLDWLNVSLAAGVAVAGAAACSNNSVEVGTADAAVLDTGVVTTDAAPSQATLTVLNFLKWCSVSINGDTASADAIVTAPVTVGSTATIVVTPSSSAFLIGADPWFGVSENNGGAAPGVDNGSGTTETSTATVVVTGNQCVSVCCQEPNMSPTPCPTTNPCP
jgi:hypothetical protein